MTTPSSEASSGPLAGLKVVEFAGMGPAPFCSMLLADLGAEVVRIDRALLSGKAAENARLQFLNRNRRSIVIDLKRPEGVATALRMVGHADVLIEGFRPGVMERLGLGPDACLEVNPRLVYGRVTGWGQDGPFAQVAGHDINFISVVGALHAIGPRNSPPVLPLNLVADFGGGALYLAFGIVSALLESRHSGKGQVVDAAMVDGTASLLTSLFGSLARGEWQDARGDNLLDGGRPWYAVYETSDGLYVSIGAIEPQFYARLIELLGLDAAQVPDRAVRENWPALRELFASTFRSRTRDEWCALLDTEEVCFSPVLSAREATAHPHVRERGVFVDVAGTLQPAPAPRFSRTVAAMRLPPPLPGEHTEDVLRMWGFSPAEVHELGGKGIVRSVAG